MSVDLANLNGEAETRVNAVVKVVFYKLKPNRARTDFLARSGMEFFEASTSTRAIRLAREHRARYIVLDASVGSNGPEKIVAALEDAEWGPIHFLWSGGDNPSRFVRRARRMGADAVHAWPEGIFGVLVAELEMVLKMTLRVHERVLVDQRFADIGRSGEGGRLVNLSASGALVRFDEQHEGDRFHVDFTISDDEPPITVIGKVVRRVAKGRGELVALRFHRITPRQQRQIREFVRQCNSVGIEQKGTPPPRAKVQTRVGLVGQKRRDYFTLARLTEEGAMLIPNRSFEAPFAPDAELELEILKPRRKMKLRARVVRSELVEPGRIDSVTGWIIRFDPAPDLQALDLIHDLQAYEREAPRKPAKTRGRHRDQHG